MFVYVGGDTVIDAREVVAILDARHLQRAPDARALWARAARGRSDADVASARTLIVTVRGLTLAPITPLTVARRVGRRMTPRAQLTPES